MSTTESPCSPLAPAEPALDDDMVITVTEAARVKLVELRDEEPEGDALGVRIEVLSDQGTDFVYDLSFAVITASPLSDVVRNHRGLRAIIPGKDVVHLEGATLDYELDGLVLRNPNKPRPFQLGNLTITGPMADDVRSVIDAEINPALDAHGGFVTFTGHDDEGRVYLTMGGGCHGCSMSRMTMLQGVQSTILERVQGTTKVLDVTDHASGANPYYAG